MVRGETHTLAGLDAGSVVEAAVAAEELPDLRNPDGAAAAAALFLRDNAFLAERGLDAVALTAESVEDVLSMPGFRDWHASERFEEAVSADQRRRFRIRFDAFVAEMAERLCADGSLRAWRTVSVSAIEDDPLCVIVSDGLGAYWSHERESARVYWDDGGAEYVLEVEFQENQVDWFTTALLNVSDTAGYENELRARPEARVVLAAVHGPDGAALEDCRIGTMAWPLSESYVHGRCHLWALALHEATGWQIIMAWDMEPEYDDLEDGGPPALVHAWCRTPDGRAVDALGSSSEDEILDRYEHVRIEVEEWDADGVRDLVARDILEAPEEGEIESLAAALGGLACASDSPSP